jgi:MOSC domain-containing protein YiiM
MERILGNSSTERYRRSAAQPTHPLMSNVSHPVAKVTHIFVAPVRGAPVRAVAAVEALADQGLRGDRYTDANLRRSPDYQVTLIELENIDAFSQATGLALTPEMPRRNIVTLGIRLNDLCGKRFNVGGAIFEGLELCEPCSLFAKRTHSQEGRLAGAHSLGRRGTCRGLRWRGWLTTRSSGPWGLVSRVRPLN